MPEPIEEAVPQEAPSVSTVPGTSRTAGWWLLMVLVGFLVGQVAAAIAVTVAAAFAGDFGSLATLAKSASPPEWYEAASLGGLWVGFIGGPVAASWWWGNRRPAKDLGLAFRWIDLIGLPIGVAAQWLIGLAYEPFLHDFHNFTGPTTKLTGSAHGGGVLVIAVMTIVGAPVVEELYFRGLLLRGLSRLFGGNSVRVAGLGLAAIVDGLLFGVAHGEWAQFAGLAVFGILLSCLAMRTRRLGMGILAHASFNAVAIWSVLGHRLGL